jgi:hypothetical protein
MGLQSRRSKQNRPYNCSLSLSLSLSRARTHTQATHFLLFPTSPVDNFFAFLRIFFFISVVVLYIDLPPSGANVGKTGKVCIRKHKYRCTGELEATRRRLTRNNVTFLYTRASSAALIFPSPPPLVAPSFPVSVRHAFPMTCHFFLQIAFLSPSRPLHSQSHSLSLSHTHAQRERSACARSLFILFFSCFILPLRAYAQQCRPTVNSHSESPRLI